MSRSGVVGIDFGTATTLVAHQGGAGGPRVVPVGRATSWLPSVARVAPSGLVAGEDAEDGSAGPVRSVKRAISDRRATVLAHTPTGPREVDADTVMVAILRELVERADAAGVVTAGAPVRLGCPALWDGAQRRRLLDVAAAAGLTRAVLVDEPVAAGVAWLTHRYLAHGERPAGRLLVFDMGGGTLDVAVLDVAGGPDPAVSVLACIGVALAGDALDRAIARDVAADMAAHRIDVDLHPQPELAWALLERAARDAKVRLSTTAEYPIVLPRALAYPQPVRYRVEQLEQALETQFAGAEHLVVSALRAARLTRGALAPAQARAVGRDALVSDVDHVLLAGGMSRIPYVGARLRAMFPGVAVHGDAGRPPEETVVAGLADRAGYDRLNLHRPGYDVALAWSGGGRTLYEAFTPLYQPWQVYNGHSDLGYAYAVTPPEVPDDGPAVIEVRAPAGPVLTTVAVQLGPRGVAVHLRTDGLLIITDGRGAVRTLRLDAIGSGSVDHVDRAGGTDVGGPADQVVQFGRG